MAYNATYTDADVSPVAIDTVVKVIAVFASLGTLVGFVIIYNLAKKKM